MNVEVKDLLVKKKKKYFWTLEVEACLKTFAITSHLLPDER